MSDQPNKKRSNHNPFNFYLLFKQGIKGIFYYKLQLIVIVILSFLATLLLTTAMSTNARMRNDFNKYVNSTQRFDYTYNYGVENTGAVAKPIEYYFPSDLSSNYTSYGSSSLKNVTTNYNTFFNKKLYNANTIKVPTYGSVFDWFSSSTPGGSTLFENWVDNAYTDFTSVDFDASNKTVKYGNFTSFSDIGDKIQAQYFTNISAYLQKIGTDLQGGYSLTPDQIKAFGGLSVIGYDFRVSEASYIAQHSKTPDVVDTAVKSYMAIPSIHAHLQNIFSNFYEWIRNQVISYYTFFMTPAINHVRTVSADLADANTLAKAINTYIATGANYNGQVADFTISVEGQTDPQPISRAANEQLLYEYLIGEKLPDEPDVPGNKSFLGSYNYDSSLSSTLTRDKILTATSNIYTQGRRGMVNPLVYTGAGNVIAANTSELNDLQNLVISNPFADFNQSATDHKDEVDFLFHQQLAAKISDYKINFRNEVYLFDNSTKRSFRFVVLQNDPDDGFNFFHDELHMIKGVKPFLANQVAISPQYARANHINIGNLITLGGSTFYVSGYATDSYSFIPTATQGELIPNVKDSAVLYGSWAVRDTLSRDSSLNKGYYTEGYMNWKGTNNFAVDSNKMSKKRSSELYTSALMSFSRDLIAANYNLANPNAKTLNSISSTTNLNVKSFNDSSTRYNWTILPIGLVIFEIVSYVAAGILAILVLIAIWIAISKNIRRQAPQIGILKSLGVSNWTISASYLMYTFTLATLVIPLGWAIGILIQWPTAELFQTFFSLNYLQIFIDWRPLLIALAVFGTASLVISLYSSWRILHQNVTVIMKPGVYWRNNRAVMFLKNNLFAKAGFLRRFRINVISNSVRSILIIFSVVLVSSFLVTASLTLPVVIQNISNSYFKNIKYKNSYDLAQATFDNPLAKVNNRYWQGVQNVGKDYSSKGGFDPEGGVNVQPGYAKIPDYWASTGAKTPVPYFMYSNLGGDTIKPQWLGDIFAQDFGQAITTLEQCFGNNIYMGAGRSFSLGLIDGIYDSAYHSTVFEQDNKVNVAKRANVFKNIQTSFNSGLGSILHLIFNNPPSKGTWKQQVITQVLGSVPPFVSNYVNSSPSRQEQFIFGWALSLATSSTDNFTTDTNTISKKGTVQAVGVSQNSNIINFDNKTNTKNQILVSDKDATNLQTVLNDYASHSSQKATDDITLQNGVKLYNHSTNTVNIPVYANEQAAAEFGYNSSNNITPNFLPQQKAYEYLNKDNKWTILPKQWWAYDDSDFANSNVGKKVAEDYTGYFKNSSTGHDYVTTGDGQTWLEPYAINNSYITYNTQYQFDGTNNTVANNSYGFVDHFVKADGTVAPVIRPDYEYSNMHLFVPSDDVDLNYFKDPDKLNSPNWGDINNNYKQINSVDVSKEVPSWVTDQDPGYNGGWTEISPYDLRYDPAYQPYGNAPLANLLGKYHAWIYSSLASQNTDVLKVVDINKSIAPGATSDSIQSSLYPGLHLRYHILGVVPTYGDKTVYTDVKLINDILGYSLSKNYNYQLSDILDPTNKTSGTSPFYFLNPNVSDVIAGTKQGYKNNKFEFNTNNAPLNWGNALYSQAAEPLSLTNLFSDTQNDPTGAYFITQNQNAYPYSSTVRHSELLSAKELYIQRITTVCLSIAIVTLSFIMVCAILLILLISNLFVSQYERFMILMKTDGYTKTQIIRNTINVFTPYVIVAWAVGAFLTWLVIHLATNYAYTALSLAVPISVAWWVFILSFGLIMIMYSAVFLQTARKMERNTVELLRESQRHL